MNKYSFIATVILSGICIASANAQKTKEEPVRTSGLYVKAGAGYVFPAASQTRDVDGFPFNGNATYTYNVGFTSMNAKKVSFSSGVQATIGAGYMFTNNLGIELNAMIGVSTSKAVAKNQYPIVSSSGNYDVSQVITQNSKLPVILMPSVVLQTGKKFNIYLRGGLALPVKSKMTAEFQNINYMPQGYTVTFNGTQELKMKFNVGFSGALGFKVPVSKHIQVYAEASLLSLSMYLKESVLTEYYQNGINVLSRVSNPTIKYSSTVNGAGTYGTYAYPYSHIAGMAGLSISL